MKPLNQQLSEGVVLWNQHKFFEAHEVWEQNWREYKDYKFLQALIYAACGYVHYQRKNYKYFIAFLEQAMQRLAVYPKHYQGIATAQLIAALGQTLEEHAQNTQITYPVLEYSANE